MKKIATLIAGVSLVATSAMAELHLGIDMINGDSMTYTTDSDAGTWSGDAESSGLRFKIGGGDVKSSTYEFYYSMLDNEHGREDSEIGYNIRPYFDIVDDFRLYAQVGPHYGWFTKATHENAYLGFQAGVGASYLLADQFELNLGWDYRGQLFFEGFNTRDDADTTTASGSGLYFGVSYYFGGGTKSSASSTAPTHTPSTLQETPVENESDIAY